MKIVVDLCSPGRPGNVAVSQDNLLHCAWFVSSCEPVGVVVQRVVDYFVN